MMQEKIVLAFGPCPAQEKKQDPIPPPGTPN
jgi:hypothetical protein